MSTIRTEVTRPKGINRDLSPYELPPEVWSDGYNVTFRRHRTNKIRGYAAVSDIVLSAQPVYAQYYAVGDVDGFVYTSFSEAYTYNGFTDNQVGVGYSATADASWTGCNFNGVAVLNNRRDHPQVLNPDTLTEMIDLPHWDVQLSAEDFPTISPEDFAALDIWGDGSRCEVIRPYKNYLMAMDCYDELGVHYPLMIRWSSPAEAGDVPPSWSPSDPAEQAGLYSLSDTPGRIIDGLSLGDYFIIYKSDSVWTAQFVGGDFVFNFRKLFGTEAGLFAKECAVEFEGNHFVLTADGAYIHNAATKQEIMEKWVKDELFDNIDPSTQFQTRCVADHTNKEIWVYYITKDSATGWADKALIWNWDTKEWSIRDLTGISYVAEGRVDLTIGGNGVTWDAAIGTWDNQTEIWDEGIEPLNSSRQRLLLADYVNSAMYANEVTDTQLGVPLSGFVERVGIDFDDDQTFKYVTRVVPHLRDNSDVATPINVSLLVEDQMLSGGAWQSIGDFTPGVNHSLDTHIVGRYVGIRFEGEGVWDLTGYTIEWEPAGTY